MKLAEALLRRKELTEKVKILSTIKEQDVFEVKYQQRLKISDSIDEITVGVPKLTASQVTHEYDYYAQRLRLIDAAIQRTNWEIDINVDDKVWVNFPLPEAVK